MIQYKRGRTDTESWEAMQKRSVWPVMSRGPRGERIGVRKNNTNIFVECIHYINLPRHPLSYIQPCCEVSGINIR